MPINLDHPCLQMIWGPFSHLGDHLLTLVFRFDKGKQWNYSTPWSICMGQLGDAFTVQIWKNSFITAGVIVIIPCTQEPLYNTIHYSRVLDIPQFKKQCNKMKMYRSYRKKGTFDGSFSIYNVICTFLSGHLTRLFSKHGIYFGSQNRLIPVIERIWFI